MADATTPGWWSDGVLPSNVAVGAHTVLTGTTAFKRFLSRREPGLTIGEHSTMDGVQFAVGAEAQIRIGDYCYFTNAVLLCEQDVQIGNYVVIGWNATIADTDFHPVGPADRVLDAMACSPLGKGHARPAIERRPVIIEDNVWIGPNAAIMKGVRIGTGAFVEPGSLVTADVPAFARVAGNPARVVGEVR